MTRNHPGHSNTGYARTFAPTGRYECEGIGVQMVIEDKTNRGAIDKIVSRMRDVVDELAFDERRQVLFSIRAISGDIADRLEAPSSRNH